MIVHRDGGGGGWIVSQRDHALPCGEIAAALHARFFDPETRGAIVELCAMHDDGWREWESAPRTLDDGAPVDFLDLGESEHDAIWRSGIGLAESRLGPFSAAVLARHAQSLAEPDSPFGAEMSARISELMKQAMPGADPAIREWNNERAALVLRFCDLLTLMPCAGWPGPTESPLMDVQGSHHDPTIAAAEPWLVELDVWPFTRPVLELEIGLVRVRDGRWGEGLERSLAGERDRANLLVRPRPQAPGTGGQ